MRRMTRTLNAAIVSLLGCSVFVSPASAQNQPSGNLYVSKDPDTGQVVLSYPTYGCQCNHSCVYRAATPAGLIAPGNDASSRGTFNGETWTEDVPLPGSISFYARTTVVDPGGGIGRKWAISLNEAPTSAVTDAAHVYYTAGRTVYGVDGVTGAPTGSSDLGGTVSRSLALAHLSNGGGDYVFASALDGYLYRLPAPNLSSTVSRKIRRAGCAADVLIASPVVQLRDLSNQAFRSAVDQDLVFVGTHHGCGDTTGNQILALSASDPLAAPVWVFNIGDYEVNYVAGCSLDYDTNTLFCGTNQPSGSFQNTLWAVDTLTGGLKWAVDAGSVHTRPFRNPGPLDHVFVVNTAGMLLAYDASTGALDWNLSLVASPPPFPLEVDVVAESRAPYADVVFATDPNGILHGVYDGGTIAGSGIELWTLSHASGQIVVDAPAVAPALGKIYVPLSDSTLHQIEISTGTDEANRSLTSPGGGGTNVAPTLGNPGVDPAWIVGSDDTPLYGGVTKKFCVPWALGSWGQ